MIHYFYDRKVELSNIYGRSVGLSPLLSYVITIAFYQHFLTGRKLIKIVCNDP